MFCSSIVEAFEAARGAVPVGTLARATGAREVDAIGGADGTIPPLSRQSLRARSTRNIRSTLGIIPVSMGVGIPELLQPLSELEIILHSAPVHQLSPGRGGRARRLT